MTALIGAAASCCLAAIRAVTEINSVWRCNICCERYSERCRTGGWRGGECRASTPTHPRNRGAGLFAHMPNLVKAVFCLELLHVPFGLGTVGAGAGGLARLGGGRGGE